MAERAPEEFAVLIVDGKPRLMCMNCSRRAASMSMLRRVKEETLSDGAKLVTYEILPPFTLDDCRRFAAEAHGGKPSGETLQ